MEMADGLSSRAVSVGQAIKRALELCDAWFGMLGV
jgi:hypothetical protein